MWTDLPALSSTPSVRWKRSEIADVERKKPKIDGKMSAEEGG